MMDVNRASAHNSILFNSSLLPWGLLRFSKRAALFKLDQITPVNHFLGFDRLRARIEWCNFIERSLQRRFTDFQTALERGPETPATLCALGKLELRSGASPEALRAQADQLEHLSRERVRDEWLKTLEAPQPGAGVILWKRAGVLAPVWPELTNLPAATPGRIDAADVHDPVLLTATLLFQSGAIPAQAEGAVRRLRFSNRDTARVRSVVAALTDTPPAPGQARDVRRWLSRHRDVANDALAVSEPRARRGDLLAAVRAVESAGDPPLFFNCTDATAYARSGPP